MGSALGIVEGTLSAEESDGLAGAIHWNALEALAQLGDLAFCIDTFGGTSIDARGFHLHCRCGPDCGSHEDDELAHKEAALQQVVPWVTMLTERGTPVRTSLLAAAYPVEAPRGPGGMWPLTSPMNEIEHLVQLDRSSRPTPARFDDPAELSLLRELRMMLARSLEPAVVRENGMAYELITQDELPDDVHRKIHALLISTPPH
jgi:hypothetical protein